MSCRLLKGIKWVKSNCRLLIQVIIIISLRWCIKDNFLPRNSFQMDILWDMIITIRLSTIRHSLIRHSIIHPSLLHPISILYPSSLHPTSIIHPNKKWWRNIKWRNKTIYWDNKQKLNTGKLSKIDATFRPHSQLTCLQINGNYQ